MRIEVSNGEIVDKITILQIKRNKITHPDKLININNELDYLKEVLSNIDVTDEDVKELEEVKSQLWEVEDELRLCENANRFDDYFTTLARFVYKLNDRRAKIKKKINLYTDSKFIEEKSY